MNWFFFFSTILKAIFFSTGGFGPFPLLHADFISRAWATEKQFTEALTIGQLSPGPNGLWIISLGKLSFGLTGAILATIALIIPPFLVLLSQHFYKKLNKYPSTSGILAGIVLVVSTFSFIILGNIFLSDAPDIFLFSIFLISLILAGSHRFSANTILFFSVFFGILFYSIK